MCSETHLRAGRMIKFILIDRSFSIWPQEARASYLQDSLLRSIDTSGSIPFRPPLLFWSNITAVRRCERDSNFRINDVQGLIAVADIPSGIRYGLRRACLRLSFT